MTGPMGVPPGAAGGGGLVHYDSFGGYGPMQSMSMPGGGCMGRGHSRETFESLRDPVHQQPPPVTQAAGQVPHPARRASSVEEEELPLPPPPPPVPNAAPAHGITGCGHSASSSGNTYAPYQQTAPHGSSAGAVAFIQYPAGAAGYPGTAQAPGGMGVRGLTPPSLLQSLGSPTPAPHGPEGGPPLQQPVPGGTPLQQQSGPPLQQQSGPPLQQPVPGGPPLQHPVQSGPPLQPSIPGGQPLQQPAQGGPPLQQPVPSAMASYGHPMGPQVGLVQPPSLPQPQHMAMGPSRGFA